jgi:DNA mismatch endonuclease (patch repair protein)
MEPSSPEASARFRRVARRDTPPEMRLRRELYSRGLRYRVDAQPIPGLRRRADLVFPGVRVAVFVDGCFWHGCLLHMTWPQANAEWWRTKIERNCARDQDTDRRLTDAGWTVVRVWEHEHACAAADRVAQALSAGAMLPTAKSRRS